MNAIASGDDGLLMAAEDGSRAPLLEERLRRAMAEPNPDWEAVSLWAAQMSAIARGERWLSDAERLRNFASYVFYECRLHLATEPWCLPILGAAGGDTGVAVRGFTHRPGATRVWAEECLAALMVELFDEQKPRYGAIAACGLGDARGTSVVVVMEGAAGDCAAFVGPHPTIEPDPPHLVAEAPGRHAEHVEVLQDVFAGRRPRIHLRGGAHWKAWLARAAEHAERISASPN